MMYVLATSLHSFRKKPKTYFFAQHIDPNFYFSRYLSVALIPAVSQINDHNSLLFLFGAPRVCLWMVNKKL